MKARKLIAWIALVAMVMTLIPSSFAFASYEAGTEDKCPEITVTMYTQDSNTTAGDDLLVSGANSYDEKDGGYFTTTADKKADESKAWQQADKIATTTPTSRRQALNISVKSNSEGEFGNNHAIYEGAIQYSFMDLDKEPLKVTDSGLLESSSWADAEVWQDYYELRANPETTYEGTIDDFNSPDEPKRYTVVAAANQQLVSNHNATVAIWNIVKTDFEGYIRVRAEDNNGYISYQDILVIADGKYPTIEVKSTTSRNGIGSVDVDPAFDNTTIVPGRVYRQYLDQHYNTVTEEIASPWLGVEDTEMKDTIDNYLLEEKYWASSDITVNVTVNDEYISSELASLKYQVFNINSVDEFVLSQPAFTGETTIEVPEYEASRYGIKETAYSTIETPITITEEGQNVLVLTATDKAGLSVTYYYYFFIDKTAPEADYVLVQLGDQVAQLFSDADTVTKWQQGVDMSSSYDKIGTAQLISGIDYEKTEVFQYRLLARDYSVAEADIDLDTVDADGVPVGYTAVAPANTNLPYGTWEKWSLDSTKAIITEEFDGLIQVRVQDRAGNWSLVTAAEEESILADNEDAVLSFDAFKVYADDSFDIYDSILESATNPIENRETKWVNESALLWAQVTDEDLANKIRSSGLVDGTIEIDVDFNEENEGKSVTLYGFDAYGNRDKSKDLVITDEATIDSSNIEDYCVTGAGGSLDKQLGFMIQYDGTGVADITFTITDKADNVLDYSDAFEYNVRLKVDKINPYILYKGYDITDAAKEDLLKANTAMVDYEVRNMPWGPNSQVLEVVVKDDDITPVQSKTNNIKFNADKSLDLYKYDGDVFTKIKTYDAGSDNVVALTDCEVLANDKYETNVGYKFYLVYEGTGIAKVEFYADDSADKANVRNYPLAATMAALVPVEYDAMLRVDKINPVIKNAKLVQTDKDVNDKNWILDLFTFNETDVDVNTRKQMKLAFEISDEDTTAEQSGTNLQEEKFADVDLIDVYDKYVEKDKTHLYENKPTTYATDDANDKAVDPHIDYILLPVETGAINGLGGNFAGAASDSNEDIEALVATYLGKEYNSDGDKCEWKNASWKDGAIVIPDEFQGAIVLRTIDRVGNIDYSAPITFVAESREALIDFNPQNGFIWSQNNYGWSKRDYDYIEIRVKDDNEDKVDAWLENAFISVTDLEGNDISTKDTVKFAHKIHANDPEKEDDPTQYYPIGSEWVNKYEYVSLADFTNEAAYGYDVIDKDGLVEKLARDEEGYIHLGYVRVEESAQIKVTIFDKAKYDDVEYTGNKTTGVWTSRIDRVAPVVTAFDLVPLYEGPDAEDNNNGFALVLSAEDALSGMAPDITDADYNVYTPENIPVTGVFATDDSFLYTISNDADVEIERFNSGTFNKGQYELPGLQYALIPGNGYLDEVAPWNFEVNPAGVYDVDGYNGEMGKNYVWHNYTGAATSIIPADFDGFIVARAIDKAGNITVVGYSTILDVEADDDWNKETQFVQVRTDNKWNDGSVTSVQYYGNNNLLFPKEMRKDLSNSLNWGEGAIIEVAEQGITNVVVTATEDFVNTKTEQAKYDLRNATWEGEMILGNATATGYTDWKYQVVDVKIDKEVPDVDMTIYDEDGNVVGNEAVEGIITIEASIFDPIPNIPDELEYRSHIPSDIAKVEWCAIPEGSDEEKWVAATDWANGEIGTFDADAFTGTIKVRAIDNAGNETVKSQRINVDGVKAIINLSKSHDDIYSLDPVDVFVTVTENAEFSDVAKVDYVVTDENGNVVESDVLTLIGGTVSVDREGTTKVTVTAETKAGVQEVEEIIVKIDRTAPTFELDVVDSMGSVKDRSTNEDVTIKALNVADAVSGVAKVEYAVIPEGSSEENYAEIAEAAGKYEVDYTVDEAFTGTVKVRVTDVAGIETVKSMKINIDKKAPLVVVSKSNEEDYSTENVNVFVTVTENAEYSDVVSVTYTVNGGAEKGLALTGGTISITEEGTSVIKVVAKTKAGVKAEAETTVLIDKTAPTFELDVVDSVGSVKDRTTNEDVTIKALNVADAVSGVAKVEYAVIPEGSSEENYAEIAEAAGKYEVVYAVAEAFTGTVKVRVTDVAGIETVKSMKINIDKKAPLVVISKSNEEDYSTENVNVFVTVTENAEYSDVVSVTYTVNDGAEKELALTGGTISITEEGTSVIKVVAKTKAGVKAEAETTVLIDKTAPTFELDVVDSEGSVAGKVTNEDVTIKALNVADAVSGVAKVEYAVIPEGSSEENYTEIAEAAGKYEVVYAVAKAFTGTVKVRVTDKAGIETVKSMKIDVDKVKPVISISKSYETTYSKNPVDVFVTVTENAEFSDVAKVDYVVTDENGNVVESDVLTLTGGTVSVDREGTTKVTVTAETKAGVQEVEEIIVKIDRTAPTFELNVVDSTGSVAGKVTNEDVTIKALDVADTVSGVAKVEYAVIPEGSSEENYAEIAEAAGKYEVVYAVAKAFTGTVKVRVTDKAGIETVKSMKIDVDKVRPVISISKSYETTCSKNPVDVFVTVTENAEFSDVEKVDYVVTDENDDVVESGVLTLIGGTVTVDREGTTKVTVTAETKAGVEDVAETTVVIHYNKLAMPVIEGVQPGSWKVTDPEVKVVYAGTETVFYSLNGSDWKEVVNEKIALAKGANKILLQARSADCQCVSEINTFDINYDEGTPIVEVDYNGEWTADDAVIAVAVNRGACESDVKSVTYNLTKKNGTPVTRYLTTEGGNIIIREDGEWTVDKITVNMVSGITYTDTNTVAVVKVDKTAPELNFNLEDTADLAGLFGMADKNSQYQQKLSATANDAFSGIAKLEYAVMEKGVYNPTWVAFEADETPTVIKTAFDGTVLVRATDNVGNTAIASKTVFTEGIKPEISITAPTGWINTDAHMNVSVVDKGLSSEIAEVEVIYYDGEVVEDANKLSDVDAIEAITSEGGTITVKREGVTTVVVKAKDVAGNVSEQAFTVKIDKSAPTFTGVVNNYIYNHDVVIDNVADALSGIKSVDIVYTNGTATATRNNIQDSYTFSESGNYNVTFVDYAGNVSTVAFTINKNLKYVINVTEVDEMGRVKVEVLDGSMLSFYQKAEGESRFTSMNVKHDSVWIERTGVYYINAKDDNGNVSNTLYIIVAPSKDVTVASLLGAPNRDIVVNLAADENVTITKVKEIFNEEMSDVVYSGSGATQPNVELFDDGVYKIENR